MTSIIRKSLLLSFIIYSLYLLYLLFIQSRGFGSAGVSFEQYIQYSTNFMPFDTIYGYVYAYQNHTLNTDIIVRNLAGNIIAFTPLGFFLPIFFAKLRELKWFIITIIAIICTIELAQLITLRGSLDIDDLLLNVPGALLGWLVWKLLSQFKFHPVRHALRG